MRTNAGGDTCRSPTNSICSTNSISCASSAALFFIPHIIGKITVPATLEFYVNAGFKPPRPGCIIAGAIETVLTVGLFFGIYTAISSAFIAFIHLLVAAAATYKVKNCWIWVIGGIEYCVFWAICCLVVAMHAWHTGCKLSHRKEIFPMASVLFSPITMRGLTLPNRVVVSPMCQYNSNNGSANDWHLMHLGNMSLGAAGLVMCEMTNVNPQGRISPKCAGMYSDENEAALKRVHDFCRQYGVAKLGVQLAHAGRKGPTTPPAAGGKPILEGPDAWTPEAPSAIPYDTGWPVPHAMTKDDIKRCIGEFAAAGQAHRPHRL